MTEADTCRTYVVPKLDAAGWDDDLIAAPRVIVPRRIVPLGSSEASYYPRRDSSLCAE